MTYYKPWPMIFYKSWIETKHRFAALAIVLAGLCAYIVLIEPSIVLTWKHDKLTHPEWADPPWLGTAMTDYGFFIWHFLYDYLFQVGWILAVCLLGTGGLLSDSINGSLIYSLSLPVRRTSFIFARFWVLVTESAALALIPTAVVPVLSLIIGERYPLAEALSHSLLMFAGGMVFVAGAIVVTSLLRNEFAGLLLSVFFLMIPQILMRSWAGRNPGSWVARSGVAMAMSAQPHIRSWTDVSWNATLGSVACAAVLIFAGARLVARSELFAA